MKFSPGVLDLRSGLVALFGADRAARHKLHRLRAAGTSVRWFPDDVDVAEEVLLASAPPGRLEVSFVDPSNVELSEFIAVVAASDPAVNRDLSGRARAGNIPVDVTGAADLSSFVLPYPIGRADRNFALDADGTPPSPARGLRDRIRLALSAHIGELVAFLSRAGRQLAAARRPHWASTRLPSAQGPA